MMNQSRRTLFFCSLAGLGTLLGMNRLHAQNASASGNPEKERIIKIQAKKFVYTPNQITIKKGEHIVLELSSVDFVHGFKLPDFNIRADLQPGKLTQIRLNPDREGRYDFLCDNFCGSGHEEMNGVIIVKA